MDYAKFSSADFICDELFQDWIINPGKETDEFWNEWLSQHPDKLETIEEAKNLLLQITFNEDFPTEEQVQSSLASTLSKINRLEEQNEDENSSTRVFRLKQIIKIAAVFIIIALSASILLYNYWNEKIFISTKYSEIKNVELPDGSNVVLNAHSTISYYKHRSKSSPRQVWLDGEAYFEVKHINKNEKEIKASERFIVSTTDLNIKVLGTSFNVKKRTRVTEVILKSGKIRIEFNDKLQPAITMAPGEMIAYNKSSGPFVKPVDPAIYTTWMDKKLILKESSITEISQYIRDYYGYKVILQDSSIGKRKMEGTLLLDDMQDVLFVLSSTLNIEIEKQGDSLIFKKRR
jgi:transmembrane sensor